MTAHNHQPPFTERNTLTEHQGRCLCGRYTFTVEDNPIWVAYCHCESCRRCTGAPTSIYVGYPEKSGTFSPSPPTFASSPRVRRAYCERCSTPLAYESDSHPGETHLFRSNFPAPDHFEPTRHVFFNEREPDFDVYDDLPRYGAQRGRAIGWGHRPAIRVLFLCTANSARSILAEGLLNLRDARLGERRIRAHSAGSTPSGQVRTEALTLLADQAFRLDRLRSKSWDEFSDQDAPVMDWVITLCDNAAAETCPAFPGRAQRQHWGLPDPASGTVSFDETHTAIRSRIDTFLTEIGAE